VAPLRLLKVARRSSQSVRLAGASAAPGLDLIIANLVESGPEQGPRDCRSNAAGARPSAGRPPRSPGDRIHRVVATGRHAQSLPGASRSHRAHLRPQWYRDIVAPRGVLRLTHCLLRTAANVGASPWAACGRSRRTGPPSSATNTPGEHEQRCRWHARAAARCAHRRHRHTSGSRSGAGRVAMTTCASITSRRSRARRRWLDWAVCSRGRA
jgi:hypothetical protein